MVKVFVGVGSNTDREKNIKGGLQALTNQFGALIISPVYQCKPFGFEGDDFLNLVASFLTSKGIDVVINEIKRIEHAFGRVRKEVEARYSSRTLDIDLLLYGDMVNKKYDVPREDIKKYPFVLKPLFDVEPDLIHPKTGESISDLWQNFDMKSQSLTEIDVCLHEA